MDVDVLDRERSLSVTRTAPTRRPRMDWHASPAVA
jgi:hypothetical protein